MGAQLEEIIRAILNHPELKASEIPKGVALKVKISNLEIEVCLPCNLPDAAPKREQP